MASRRYFAFANVFYGFISDYTGTWNHRSMRPVARRLRSLCLESAVSELNGVYKHCSINLKPDLCQAHVVASPQTF